MKQCSNSPCVVVLKGDLDFYRAPEIEQRLSGIEKCGDITIDLSDVRFIDASFISQLARLYHRNARHVGMPSIKIIARPFVVKILSIVEFTKYFKIEHLRPAL